MRQVVLDKIQAWFDAGKYRSAYSLAKNLVSFDYRQSFIGFAPSDSQPQEWVDRIEAIGGHIPEYVVAFCREHGHTEAFEKDGRWWAFPPNRVMPIEVVNPEHLIGFGVTSYGQAMRAARSILRHDSRVNDRGIRVFEPGLSEGPIEGLSSDNPEVRMFGDDRVYRASELGIGLHFDRDRFNQAATQAFNRKIGAVQDSCVLSVLTTDSIGGSPNNPLAVVNRGQPDDSTPFSIAYLRGLRDGWRYRLARQQESERWATDPLNLMPYFPRLNLWAIGEGIRDFAVWLDSVGEWLQKLSDRLEK